MNDFPSKGICGLCISLQGLITFDCIHTAIYHKNPKQIHIVEMTVPFWA